MPAPPPPTQEMNYVLDGGSLLYRLPWPRGTTFDSICTMYVNYIKKFPQPTIVFDGCEAGPSTKDTTHLRRSGGVVVGAKVNFDGSTPVASKKRTLPGPCKQQTKVCGHAFSEARGRWLSCSAGSR